ncbi:MAG: hypothetical protein QF718_00325 [Phycisphaerales bacterium]|jgi:DNA-binding response OmpR family regulator|nr:hypothetical protein [Phycisphaerales bacterium]
MDQFDKAFKNINNHKLESGPANILVLGSETSTVDAIRASLEIHGHSVTTATSISSFEEVSCNEKISVVFVSADYDETSTETIFESISLLSPTTVAIGYSSNPSTNQVIQFIRNGGSDFINIPKDLNRVAERTHALLQKQQEDKEIQDRANYAVRLCGKMNEARHLAEETNDALNNELANVNCETQQKMQQCAIGAEFQTLLNQELEVESMLRTALGYMLTRVGAMNAVVYLREGMGDWGIGAYINYDRQPEQFQSLIDTIGPAVCSVISTDEQIKHVKNGERFADAMGLDPTDFSGNEVVSYGCFSGDQCMAVIVLFRDESRTFKTESINTIETTRSIFGQQLDTIVKIHHRAESHWPSESIDDDDWLNDKAA